MNPEKILPLIISGIFICFAFKLLINLYQDRKNQKALLSPNDLETDDLRVWSQSYRKTFISFGEDFDYLKFHFTNNEVFVFMRNSFPGVYKGPFLIKEKVPKNYSYLGKLDLTKFSVIGNDIRISFGHRNFIGVKYNFHLTNISDDDIEMLKSNLC